MDHTVFSFSIRFINGFAHNTRLDHTEYDLLPGITQNSLAHDMHQDQAIGERIRNKNR